MTEQLPPSPAEPPKEPSANADGGRPAAARKQWSSEELLGDQSEVLIVHGDEVYRLRRTRQDKLILYK